MKPEREVGGGLVGGDPEGFGDTSLFHVALSKHINLV